MKHRGYNIILWVCFSSKGLEKIEANHIMLRTQSSEGGGLCCSRQAQELGMCHLSKNWPKSTWLKPDRLWTKKVKVLEWLSQNTNLCPIKHLWNYLKLKFTNSLHSIWCSLSVFFTYSADCLMKTKGTECFCSFCSDSSFCFQRSPDYYNAGDGGR